jgi:hypothetical protein
MTALREIRFFPTLSSRDRQVFSQKLFVTTFVFSETIRSDSVFASTAVKNAGLTPFIRAAT